MSLKELEDDWRRLRFSSYPAMYRSESLGEGGGVIPITGDGSSLTNYLPGSWGRSPCELFAQPQSVLVRSVGFELWQIQICITKRPPAQKKYHGREFGVREHSPSAATTSQIASAQEVCDPSKPLRGLRTPFFLVLGSRYVPPAIQCADGSRNAYFRFCFDSSLKVNLT